MKFITAEMMDEIESALKEPFPYEDLEWRIAQAGKKKDGNIWAKCFTYISARAVMARFDEVVGAHNWQVRYQQWHGGVVASIGIKVDGEWIWKEDGSDASDTEPV
jgi:Uncharacterized protein conserved in bacteria